MFKRKLQVFISSTYEDLIDHRLAAIEAVLAAGHIPAAMEQFSPGDDTAWERITQWIDESDAFVLILGGRYGSIKPDSGKGYVELEYDYAMEQGKPLFALVVDEKHHEERVREHGLAVDERDRRPEYDGFRAKVTARLCKFWKKKDDIQMAIFQKLPEWAQREELSGWVRAEEAQDPRVAGELARLSEENAQLRERGEAREPREFGGFTFDELVGVLRETDEPNDLPYRHWAENMEETHSDWVAQHGLWGAKVPNSGVLLEVVSERLLRGLHLKTGHNRLLLGEGGWDAVATLLQLGLLTYDTELSEMGSRFVLRTRLWKSVPERMEKLWLAAPQDPSPDTDD